MTVYDPVKTVFSSVLDPSKVDMTILGVAGDEAGVVGIPYGNSHE